MKSGGEKHGERLVKYIATREGVEKCDEFWKDRPATKEQERLIQELTRDFPNAKDSFEYRDYAKSKTKYAATEFINRTIEENVALIGKKENYVGYIAMRPRVEKQGTHGLFSQEDAPIDLAAVSKTIAEHEGVVWTSVISLRREDAAQLGYDRAKTWKDMLRSRADELAKAMGIPLADLRWYAAFHNEGGHPHVHLVSYSEGKEPYMTEQGLKKLKASYAHEIFRQDLYHVYDELTVYRDKLREESKEKTAEIINRINSGGYRNETVELMLKTLSEILKTYSGKKVYGYLPKKAKNLVNGIVDELAKDERIAELYELWYRQKEEVIKTYRDTMPLRVPLSQNSEFKTVRNAVITEAMNLVSELDPIEGEETTVSETEPEDKETERKARYSAKTMWGFYFWAKELLDKEGGEYDPRRAVGLLMESAYRGNTVAKYRLGKMYLLGEEVRKNVDVALRWLEEAAKDKNEYAEYLLGKLLLKGEEVERDVIRAEELLRRSAGQGNKYAAYTLGKALLDGEILLRDIPEAMNLLKAAADKNFMPAQYVLGKLLYRGVVVERDVIGALKYLEQSAEQNNPDALYLAGKIYLREETVKNIRKAISCFEAAARQGNHYAEYQLGKIYLYGHEIERDEERAMAYLNAAALHGNEYAARLLEQIKTDRKQFSGEATRRGVCRLFQALASLLQSRTEEQNGKRILTDKKLRRRIGEKRQAQGLKHG